MLIHNFRETQNGEGHIMFKDLFDFKRQRTPVEAVGFFIFYAGIFIVVSAVFGIDVLTL